MNLLQSKMWPETLVYIHSILLAYAPEQICLPHCTYMFHCTSTTVLICSHSSTQIHKIPINYNNYLLYYCKICASKQYAPQCQNIPHAQITTYAFMEKEVYWYICHIWWSSHQWCSQNHCTQKMTVMMTMLQCDCLIIYTELLTLQNQSKMPWDQWLWKNFLWLGSIL